MITMTITPLFIGTTEMILIAGVALLLFGGKKLPEMMRGLGQGVKEFKNAANEVTKPVDDAGKEVSSTLKDNKDSDKQ